MDERLAAFLRRYQLPEDAGSELDTLVQWMLSEVQPAPTPFHSPQDSFDRNQTFTDPVDGSTIQQTLSAILDEDSTQPGALKKQEAPFASQDTERATELSLPPFQIPSKPLAWPQLNSTASNNAEVDPSKPLSMAESESISLQELPSVSEGKPMHPLPPDERYEDLGSIGVGGMGEVRRVRDRQLKRVVAMKVIRKELTDDFSLSIRFIEEAQATAQLQHPSIIPLHDLGQLPDGRYFFTMKEIKGKTLEEVITEVHSVSRPVGEWKKTSDGWTIRRILDAFRDVCEAVGYAHSRGVLHRDIKPENVMLGAYGEVLVLDWGLVKVKGHTERNKDWRQQTSEIVITDRSQEDEYVTMIGAVTGTPTYMSPEQAMGREDIDARSDVYALGAVLYEILSGNPPYYGEEHDAVLTQLLKGPPPPLVAHGRDDIQNTWERAQNIQTTPPLPPGLVRICERAMSRSPFKRYPTATEMAQAIGHWLEGDQKREQALEMVEEANKHLAQAEVLKEQTRKLQSSAQELLEPIQAWEPEENKKVGWSYLDEAKRLEREATIKALESELSLVGALVHDPLLVEARTALANRYRAMHKEAELRGNKDEQLRTEQMLFNQLQAIPPGHPDFKKHISYLKGDGSLTLITDPPGAEVVLYRYVEQHRRLLSVRARVLGHTPIVKLALPMGSYLLLIRKEGYVDVRYPIEICRQEHWEGIAPGDEEPLAITLPKEGHVLKDECYVPAGWFWSGGDPDAINTLPKRRLWLDGFVIRKHPITHMEYLAFLNTLIEEKREAEATRYAPTYPGDSYTAERSIYERSTSGNFIPHPRSSKYILHTPVTHVTLQGARAFAQWKTAMSGQMWCLPDEMEWEKAARGVDGRFFPWGNWLDPSWCCMRESNQHAPKIDIVENWPVDESPYGVRGMAGNVRDWCSNSFRSEGPRQAEISVRTMALSVTGTLKGFDYPSQDAFDVVDTSTHTLRGGSWNDTEPRVRIANRRGGRADYPYDNVGFRLIRYL